MSKRSLLWGWPHCAPVALVSALGQRRRPTCLSLLRSELTEPHVHVFNSLNGGSLTYDPAYPDYLGEANEVLL